MKEVRGQAIFGCLSQFSELNEVIEFLDELVGEDAIMATVAYGMLVAANSTAGGVYRQDALDVLTELSYAKAKLDSSVCHTSPTIDVTGEILLKAQQYANSVTIPCTEWPTSDDIIENVLSTAKKYSVVKEWKKVIRNSSGAVVGVEKIENF